jgi:hypothetical protein
MHSRTTFRRFFKGHLILLVINGRPEEVILGLEIEAGTVVGMRYVFEGRGILWQGGCHRM